MLFRRFFFHCSIVHYIPFVQSDHLKDLVFPYRKIYGTVLKFFLFLLLNWLSLVVSLMASVVLSFFPLDVLDEIWNLIESVSEGFLTYS